MPHCTANIGWYIGKFVLNISAILFIYWGFLKEKDIKCYCPAIERESRRETSDAENDRDKLQSRCNCRHRRGTTYSCGCQRDIKKNVVGENVRQMPDNEESTDTEKICDCSRK